MVVDDDEGMLVTIKKMLASEGITVLTASSGEECMRKLENTRPDCILLDIMMPEMDGWMVLEAVKKNEKVKDMPVLIITAKPASPNILQEKDKRGYVDYINKPFTKSELLESLYALGIE
jgi:CheY-like chemotaxis protein